MIGQCLSNKNESTTVAKKPKFYQLNKASDKQKTYHEKRQVRNIERALARALFSSEKISNFGTVVFSFVCDKYYLIMD